MANTIDSDIQTALFEHLDALALVPALKIAYPNTKFKSNSSSYLEVRVFQDETLTHLIGSNDPKVYRGTLQINVVSKEGKGTIEPLKVAGLIMDHFKMGTRLTSGSIALHVPKQPSTSPSFTDKDKFKTPVRIPYFSSN